MDRSATLIICLFALPLLLFQSVKLPVLVIVWLVITLYSIKDINNRSALFLFLISFFTFLLGRLIISSILPSNQLPDDFFNKYIDFSESTEQFVFSALIVSLVCLFIGYSIGEKPRKVKHSDDGQSESDYARNIRKASAVLVYITFAFCICEILEKVYYVGINGYFEYYATFTQSLPYVVYKLSSFFVFAVFLNLATLPSKKEAKPILLLYLITSLVKLMIGARGAIIYPLFLVIIYLFIRTSISPEDPWITKRGKRALLISAPLVCLLMAIVGIVRTGNDAGGLVFLDALTTFFYNQGASYQIIGFVYDTKQNLPPDQIYSIGPVFHIFDGSIIGRILGIDHKIVPQTIKFALEGDDLGSFLTYWYDTTLYTNGAAYGSCYIGEAYADLGWFGVVLSNILVGYLLARVTSWMSNRIWISVVAFFMLQSFMRAPRGTAFAFLADILDVNLWLLAFLLHIIAKRCRKPNNNSNIVID